MSKEAKRHIKTAQPKTRIVNLLTKAAASGKDFVDADVTVASNQITEASHGFITGDRLQLTTSGVLPAGLALATDYWVVKINKDTFGLASSLANAIAGTLVVITAAAGGGTHTATLTEVKSGLDRYRGHIVQVQSTGIYKIILDPAAPFASAEDIHAYPSIMAADRRVHVSAKTASSVTVNVETMAGVAVDDFFDVMIVGSETSTRW